MHSGKDVNLDVVFNALKQVRKCDETVFMEDIDLLVLLL